MKRVLTLVFAMGLLLYGGASALAADKIVLKAAQDSSVEHPMQKGLEKFKEVLEAETGGLVEVQIFPNAQLGSPLGQPPGGIFHTSVTNIAHIITPFSS